MHTFNEITIERSPYDQESIIKGLTHDFENSKHNQNLKIVGGTISLAFDNEIPNDFVGITLPTNTTQD